MSNMSKNFFCSRLSFSIIKQNMKLCYTIIFILLQAYTCTVERRHRWSFRRDIKHTQHFAIFICLRHAKVLCWQFFILRWSYQGFRAKGGQNDERGWRTNYYMERKIDRNEETGGTLGVSKDKACCSVIRLWKAYLKFAYRCYIIHVNVCFSFIVP